MSLKRRGIEERKLPKLLEVCTPAASATCDLSRTPTSHEQNWLDNLNEGTTLVLKVFQAENHIAYVDLNAKQCYTLTSGR